MRIGQVAALVGVSTRTIRHYHHAGVLPEPTREPNGYRRYSIHDAVMLARARRLTALGMSLDEVADALAGSEDADLQEILDELDQDLAQQEHSIRQARQSIAELQRRAQTGGTLLDPPMLIHFIEHLTATGTEGQSAQLDAQLMSLLPENEATRWISAILPDPADQRSSEALSDLYEQMDAIADANPSDPRVSRVATQIVGLLPTDITAEIALIPAEDREPIVSAISSQLTPGQQAVLRRVIDNLSRS